MEAGAYPTPAGEVAASAEAADDLYLHALVEIGLVLFVITLAVNMISRAFIWSMSRQRRPRPAAPVAVPAGAGA